MTRIIRKIGTGSYPHLSEVCKVGASVPLVRNGGRLLSNRSGLAVAMCHRFETCLDKLTRRFFLRRATQALR